MSANAPTTSGKAPSRNANAPISGSVLHPRLGSLELFGSLQLSKHQNPQRSLITANDNGLGIVKKIDRSLDRVEAVVKRVASAADGHGQ